MGRLKHSVGFTIIEVMLFLAVSGALATGIMVTSTVGINNQRYIDAVNSFKALVQEEFTNTTQVANSRQSDADSDCVTATSPIGASNCVVVGRLMTISPTGDIVRSNLIGVEPTKDDVVRNDLQEVIRSNPEIDSTQQTTSAMNWGTYVKDHQPVSIVIVRSPASGNVLSFVKKGTPIITEQSELAEFLVNAANNQPQVICVDPSGWTIAQPLAVMISAYAAGPSGVETEAGAQECA